MIQKLQYLNILLALIIVKLSFAQVEVHPVTNNKIYEDEHGSVEVLISYPVLVSQKAGIRKINDFIADNIAIHLETEQEEFIEQYKEAGEFPFDGMNFTMYDSTYVKTNEKHLMVIATDWYSYTGGAHGIFGSAFYNFDAKTGDLVQLEDIIKEEGKQLLPDLIEIAIREAYEVPSEQTLGGFGFFLGEDGQVPLPATFYVSTEGIGFFYQPYEITPYVFGTVDVVVPYRMLKGNLKKNPVLGKNK